MTFIVFVTVGSATGSVSVTGSASGVERHHATAVGSIDAALLLVQSHDASYSFSPPTYEDAATWKTSRFWSRYDLPKGQSIVRSRATSQLLLHPYPSMDDLSGLTEGTDYYLGGHDYRLTADQAQALEDAGFDVPGYPPPTDN